MPSYRILRMQLPAALLLAALCAGQAGPSAAADNSVTIGIDFPLTDADADSAARMEDGALLAFDEANAKGDVAGYKIRLLLLDDGRLVAFDARGDIKTRQVSVFQVVKDPKYPLDDMLHQYRYIGVAPPTS
jgi:branched-chain amino acid transport system substrate-binding protein